MRIRFELKIRDHFRHRFNAQDKEFGVSVCSKCKALIV